MRTTIKVDRSSALGDAQIAHVGGDFGGEFGVSGRTGLYQRKSYHLHCLNNKLKKQFLMSNNKYLFANRDATEATSLGLS
jgi:hypothetical protein